MLPYAEGGGVVRSRIFFFFFFFFFWWKNSGEGSLFNLFWGWGLHKKMNEKEKIENKIKLEGVYFWGYAIYKESFCRDEVDKYPSVLFLNEEP